MREDPICPVLVTGASAGIGREFAVQVAAGPGPWCCLPASLLEELRAGLLKQHPQLRVVARPVDLSDEGDVDRVLTEVHRQAGPGDVLINTVGVGDQELFDREDWSRTRQVLHTKYARCGAAGGADAQWLREARSYPI